MIEKSMKAKSDCGGKNSKMAHQDTPPKSILSA